ncbi:MAG TPA: glycosyltransferase [Candidatus Paceibacterota bacterium]|nr:glycosyltransferase [Candidatus Paceibacterota bacterium]
MRLLICAQAVDENDPALGFFCGWLAELAKRFDSIDVICLREGEHALPENVSIHPLGAGGRIARTIRLKRLAWKLRRDYDAVFVHMNQEYVLVAGTLWKMLGKPVYLWRNHYAGSFLTRIAAAFCAKVFYTSAHSYTARFANAVRMPVGVDLARFGTAAASSAPRSILFLARMSPAKRPEMLLRALAALAREGAEFSAVFCGSPLPRDRAWYEKLKEEARSLGIAERIEWKPSIANAQTPALYRAHAIFVNCSPSGMFDKTLFEAAACGCRVLASSDDWRALAGADSFFSSEAELAVRLKETFVLPASTTPAFVAANDLSALAAALAAECNPSADRETRLLYATSALFPSQMANRVQILSMARAFHEALGERFILGIPAQSVLVEGFQIARVPGSTWSFALAWRYANLIRRERITHVFCREERLLYFLMLFSRLAGVRVEFVFEAHWVLDNSFFRAVVRRADRIIATASGVMTDLAPLEIPQNRLAIEPNGVDLAVYTTLPDADTTRARYKIAEGARLIGYTGSIGVHDWKGVDILLEAARAAPPGWLFWLVGGEPKEVGELRARYPDVRFEGYQAHAQIAAIQAACDILVLPNKSRDPASERYTSPLKLFEYMASGAPILASDLPSAREIVSEEEVVFFTAGDATALCAGIAQIFADPEAARARAARARAKAGEHTWSARARRIVYSLP